MMPLTTAAIATPRVELSIAQIEANGWQAHAVTAQWQPQDQTSGQFQLHGNVTLERQPSVAVQLACPRLRLERGIQCANLRLRADAGTPGHIDAAAAVQLRNLARWTIDLKSLQARIDYNHPDGRIASEGLLATLSGRIARDARGHALTLALAATRGQAYVEPVFLDLGATPTRLNVRASWAGAGDAVALQELTLTQQGVMQARVTGAVEMPPSMRIRQLSASVTLDDLDAAVKTYLEPLLAATPLQGLSAAGRASLRFALDDHRLRQADAELHDTSWSAPRLSVSFQNLGGAAHWRDQGISPISQLHWRAGHIAALPLGAAALSVQAQPRGLRLLAPARIPVLDGALHVRKLSFDGVGSEHLAGTFDGSLEPIDLALLGRTLNWPEFGGSLSGQIPEMRLHDGVLSLGGALTAQVFGGDITIDKVKVVDPWGVLPRVEADLRLRRLDLETITRAFSFGRITGRLDGDVQDLRLINWQPTAMNARFYSTPGDRSRKRISQRAIDNISSIGGGPTGVLSRGALSLFKDFAYARMGWSCVLANGVCHMDGVAPAKPRDDGQVGYVLVQGRWLPRIDVVGYSRAVNWQTLLQQLGSVRNVEGIEVR